MQPPALLLAVVELPQFVEASFPEDPQRREALSIVMVAGWRVSHKMEPDENLLLQFASYDNQMERWNCQFWKDGKPCESSCKKKDHAKGHVSGMLVRVCNAMTG